MALFRGIIGFVENTEVEDCEWEDVVTPRYYTGTIIKNNQQFLTADTVSGNLQITNTFSIFGDSYMFSHISNIRYLEWRGQRWIVTTVDLEFPRVNMTIGGIYNGPQPNAEEPTNGD